MVTKKKLRLCYLALTPIPSRTAYSIHVMKMCQAFSESNCEVKLISPEMQDIDKNVKDSYKYYGVDRIFEHLLSSWPKIPGKAYFYGFNLMRHIKKYCPDFVYGRFLFGVYMSSILKLPCALEVHAPISDAGKLSEFIFKKLILRDSFKQLIVISGALKEWYVKNYPSLLNKITIEHDGADLLENVNVISFDKDRLQVGYIGQLYDGKGMEVIEKIAPLCTWADFHIIGGTEGDIKKWKSRLNYKNVFMYGYKPHSEVGSYQSSFDVLLAPYQAKVSAYGGNGDIGKWMSPLKLFEYMAAGKAILASNLSVLKEVLDEEETAILCNPTDYNEWVRQLKRLNESAELRRKLGENALKKFEESHSWLARADRLKRNIESWL